MPSSPVLVPEVGRGRERSAVQTIAACRRAARALRALAPEGLLLLLPGEGRQPVLLLPNAAGSDGWRRSFEAFDAPELNRTDPVDQALIEALAGPAEGAFLASREVEEIPADALAPLYFLSAEARTPVAAIEVPDGDLGGSVELGAWLAAVTRRLDRRVAIVAAGELSSKVFPGAPGGYEPKAATFDRAVVEMVAASDLNGLQRVDPARRRAMGAGLVPQALASLAALPDGVVVDPPSYEHPFGVGYLVAHLAPAGGAHLDR